LERKYCDCGKVLIKAPQRNVQKYFCSIKCKRESPEFKKKGTGSISRHYNDVTNGRIKRVPMKSFSEA
jgi:hypothetical protein